MNSFIFSGSAVRWNSSHLFYGDRETDDRRADGEGKQGKIRQSWLCTSCKKSGSVHTFEALNDLFAQSPKAFLESYEDMLLYTQREETWPITKMELEGRGVSGFQKDYI